MTSVGAGKGLGPVPGSRLVSRVHLQLGVVLGGEVTLSIARAATTRLIHATGAAHSRHL